MGNPISARRNERKKINNNYKNFSNINNMLSIICRNIYEKVR